MSNKVDINSIGCKLVSADKGNGQLLSITLQLLKKNEIEIFRRLLKDDTNGVCPKCGDPITGADTFYIRINTPLNSGGLLGMELATPVVKCDHCGKEFMLSMIDYTPFQSVVQFVQLLRKEYKKRQKG